jgi:hypothetical protein
MARQMHVVALRKEIDMKLMRYVALGSLGVLATAAVVLAQHVETDFDHQANFARYRTYSWQEIKPANSLWDDRIRRAVDAQLTAKGWTRADNGGDVAIVAIKTTQVQRRLQTFYDGFGGGWGWRRFGGLGAATTTERDYKEGTLVIDMYDAHNKQLIWRGSAEDTLSDKAEKNEKELDNGVVKMFKDFPPNAPRN